MPDVPVTVTGPAGRREQSVTTGTKAWELFRDEPDVIAARVGGELKDLAHELARRRPSSRRWPSTAPTATTSCGTRPRT